MEPKTVTNLIFVPKWSENGGLKSQGCSGGPKWTQKSSKHDPKTIKTHDQHSNKYGGLCQKAPETNAERSPLTVGTQQG